MGHHVAQITQTSIHVTLLIYIETNNEMFLEIMFLHVISIMWAYKVFKIQGTILFVNWHYMI